MTVLRQESNVRIDAKDTRSIANTQVQDARFQPNQTVRVGDQTSWRTNLVESIAGAAIKVGEKAVNVAQENAYLEGQAKAGRIKSEDELESNWLTKDWAVAGYRDTMGKLALADSESKMVTDMQELRTKDPAAMEEYLAKRRGDLTPIFSSLSREARSNMFGQLLMADRTAIVKHAGEHKAYILDTAQKGIKATMISGATTLSTLQGDAALGKIKPEEYGTAVQNYAVGIETSVWRNPMFKNEPGIKSKLTAEAIQHALDNDHLAVYEYFRDNAFEGVDGGTKRSVLADLDEGAAIKLGKSYLEGKQRTIAQREGALITQKAEVEAQMHNGNYAGTWDEFKGFVDRLTIANVVNAKGAEAMQQAFFQMQGKNTDLHGIANAAVKNDTTYLLGRGKSQTEGFDALDKVWAQGAQRGQAVPIPAQLGVLKEALDNGSTEAGKRMGVRIGPSLMQLSRPDGTVDAQHAEIMRTFNTMYESSNQTQRTQITAGMTDEQQTRFFALRENMRDLPMDAALKRVIATEERNSKMSKQELASASQVKDADITKEIDDFDSQGFLMSLKNMLIPTARNGAKAVLQPNERMWGNNTRVDDYALKMRSEIAVEAKGIRMAHPELSAESLVNKAASAVASRTLRTEQGPLFLPRGMEPNRYFGVAPSIPNEVIAQAIDKVVKPAVSTNRISYEVAAGGIAWAEYDVDGNPTSRAGILQPKSVSGAVDELMQVKAKASSEIHGTGKTVRHDTASVTFNGENAAGVEPERMFKFRENLVKNEGVRNTVYKDTKGNPTVGVGIANKAYWPKVGPDGKVDQSEINSSFRKASNDAAIFGARATEQLGLQNSESAFMLFSEFAYQGRGGSFNEFAKAVGARDKEAALKALEGTKAYQYSADSRKQHYKKLTLSVLEGK